ncbi:uncharacterized protein [Drosophila pseudoobscura]|uniref:RRM domain-containing protein n=1 Tax=Drosophila pseudoobscura pseudoobscura TaxID=46245 RepID=A0A6I8V512_DROPS|nr:uncharacterized protein LOC6899105 [Drosophila pseudoobscura]
MAHFVNNPSEQNYYFKNGIAYTEDHIPVLKLYLYKIPPDLNQSTLHSHFSNYGRVLQMKLFRGGGRRDTGRSNRFSHQTGCVFYDNPKDAAKALHSRIHHVNGRRFNVQASDSWHQPDAYGTDDQEEANQLCSFILNINDLCLEMIMKSLPMHDQTVFARTCLRFRAIYQQATARLHKSIDLYDFENMTVWDLREFFNLSGPYVQHITGVIPPMRFQRLCDFLSTNCSNLKSLKLHSSPLTSRNMHKIFAKMTKLEELELPQNQLTDECILALRNCRTLQVLNIAGNPITGVTLHELSPSIQTLTLSGCPRFQGQCLSKICKVLTNLKTLNVKRVDTMNSHVFETMIKENSGASLEVLCISAFPRETYEYVAQLPSLKSLSIYIGLPGRTIRSELFQELAEHKAEQLECLEVYGGSSLSAEFLVQISKLRGLRSLVLPQVFAMTNSSLSVFSSLKKLEQINLKCNRLHDSSILFLFESCPKLHSLGLEDCEGISEKLVHGIIKKLRLDIARKENQRNLPVQLCVSGTQVNSLIEYHPDVAPKDIIELKHFCFWNYDGMYPNFPNLVFDDFDFEPDDLEDDLDSDDESDYYGDDMFDFGFLSADDDEDSDFEFGHHGHHPPWPFMSLD